MHVQAKPRESKLKELTALYSHQFMLAAFTSPWACCKPGRLAVRVWNLACKRARACYLAPATRTGPEPCRSTAGPRRSPNSSSERRRERAPTCCTRSQVHWWVHARWGACHISRCRSYSHRKWRKRLSSLKCWIWLNFYSECVGGAPQKYMKSLSTQEGQG